MDCNGRLSGGDGNNCCVLDCKIVANFTIAFLDSSPNLRKGKSLSGFCIRWMISDKACKS